MSQLLISVIHSIPDNEALIDTVLSHYPISDIRNCKLYKRRLNDIKPDSYTIFCTSFKICKTDVH